MSKKLLEDKFGIDVVQGLIDALTIDGLTLSLEGFEVLEGTSISCFWKDDNDKIIGSYSLVVLDTDPPHVEHRHLHLDEAYQNKGIYSKLVLELSELGKKYGFLDASVSAFDPSLFLKSGFEFDPENWQATLKLEEGKKSRLEEYGEWKTKGKKQPDWYKEEIDIEEISGGKVKKSEQKPPWDRPKD